MTIRDHSYETLASKADLRDLEPRLEVRIAQLEQKIADVQIGMVKWFTGIMIAQGAAIVALVKLLPGPS
jgi:hypothetical protein